MKKEECISFLQWALPQLRLHWPGFRKVRGQVCKRIGRRIADLGLDGIEQYRNHLHHHAEEWGRLDELCRITISRFYRDRQVFAILGREVLPALAQRASERGDNAIRIWSAGCGSGEEAYTVAVLWSLEVQPRFPGLPARIVATDVNPTLLQRARRACFPAGSLKDLPNKLQDQAFTPVNRLFCLKPEYREPVTFLQQDIRRAQPDGRFDLVLCRNLAFTYFEAALQREVLRCLVGTMHDEAALVLGIHETLPGDSEGLLAWFEKEKIFKKGAQSSA